MLTVRLVKVVRWELLVNWGVRKFRSNSQTVGLPKQPEVGVAEAG